MSRPRSDACIWRPTQGTQEILRLGVDMGAPNRARLAQTLPYPSAGLVSFLRQAGVARGLPFFPVRLHCCEEARDESDFSRRPCGDGIQEKDPASNPIPTQNDSSADDHCDLDEDDGYHPNHEKLHEEEKAEDKNEDGLEDVDIQRRHVGWREPTRIPTSGAATIQQHPFSCVSPNW
jgi:hypothetical protein